MTEPNHPLSDHFGCRSPNASGLTGYIKHGCRCDRCRTAYSEWKRAWRARGGPGVERERETSARWKREHPEEAAKHNWKVCTCGNRMVHRATRCQACVDEERCERERAILHLRSEGLTNVEIGTRLGISRQAVADLIHRMRSAGVEVPASPHYLAGRAAA